MGSNTTTILSVIKGKRPRGARGVASVVGLLSLIALIWLPTSALASSHSINLISTDSSDVQGNVDSDEPSTSSDGRYVAFHSWATDLVNGDTNAKIDIFVKDNETGVLTRVSTSSTDQQASGDSQYPSISGTGRYVAFESDASDLVASDTNADTDAFVKDTQTGVITRVSTASDGTEGNGTTFNVSISADGRFVAFSSISTNLVAGDTNGFPDIFIKDTQTGTTTRVSTDSSGVQGDDDSYFPRLSPDGRYVTYYSFASNLVAGDNNADSDVFVRDTQSGTTTRVSTASDGTEGNSFSGDAAISNNGRYVAFESDANNLVPGDTNGISDIFVKDTQTGATGRVSTASDGTEGNDESHYPSISGDGRFVTFFSYASDLVPGDTNAEADVFVKDTLTGALVRLSSSSSGSEGDSGSWASSISTDGRYVAFDSSAANLVASDTNGSDDIFRATNPAWEPPTVSVWPRASNLAFGLWSKLAGTVVDGSGNPVEGQKVWLQYLDVAVSSLDKQGAGTWKWLKNVYTNSNGYYQHWFYYEGGTRTYRAKEASYDQTSNSTQIAFTNNISAWNTYRPTVKYCQWTKIHGKYGGPNGLSKNTTLYLQRKSGSSWVWQATVKTNASGYYAAWAPVCPTTQLRMGTAGSAVTSAAVTKKGSTVTAWQNSKVHAVLKNGFGSGVSGISLYLQKWNGSAWTWQATCSTSSSGYCNFGSVNPSGDVRVATWGSRVVSGTL